MKLLEWKFCTEGGVKFRALPLIDGFHPQKLDMSGLAPAIRQPQPVEWRVGGLVIEYKVQN
jgi:hypothetical protein